MFSFDRAWGVGLLDSVDNEAAVFNSSSCVNGRLFSDNPSSEVCPIGEEAMRQRAIGRSGSTRGDRRYPEYLLRGGGS